MCLYNLPTKNVFFIWIHLGAQFIDIDSMIRNPTKPKLILPLLNTAPYWWFSCHSKHTTWPSLPACVSQSCSGNWCPKSKEQQEAKLLIELVLVSAPETGPVNYRSLLYSAIRNTYWVQPPSGANNTHTQAFHIVLCLTHNTSMANFLACSSINQINFRNVPLFVYNNHKQRFTKGNHITIRTRP